MPTSDDDLSPTPAKLDEAVLLNRTVYGGEFYLENTFRADFDAALDPPSTDLRLALNVYDRYDQYLEPFGYTLLGAEDLGFSDTESVAGATAADDLNAFYRGGLYRNNFQELADGSLVQIADAAAVALVAEKDGVLHLVLRGTDADSGSDGEAATAPGQVRYYGQLQPLIDKLYDYVADPANGVTDVVVSGQSLGGTAADLFQLYDAARFDALDGVDLEVISISSAGVNPGTLQLKTDFDTSIVDVSGATPVISGPDYYSQLTHEFDFVYFPTRYDFVQHNQFAPAQAPTTAFILDFLALNVQIDGNIVEIETPLVPIYELTADFQTTFLPPHYMDLYELNGRNLAEAIEAAGRSDFDRYVALNGENFRTENVESDNTVNGWMLPDDDVFDLSDEIGDTLLLALGGDDTVSLGLGDDVYSGGDGDDTADVSAYANGAVVDLGRELARGDIGGVDLLLDVENAVGSAAGDVMRGDGGANSLEGGDGGDVLRGRNGDDAVSGGAGDDVVIGGDGDDTVVGGAGDDVLRGGKGDDALDGGAGNDRMFGGPGDDTFVFEAGHGDDVVIGFRPGEDVLDVSGLGFATFDDVLAASRDGAFATVIETSAEDSIRLVRVDLDQLSADDFIFGVA